MPYDPDHHHRRSIRLQDYDYSEAGAYFITICTNQKQCLLGEIINGEMILSWHGRAASACWKWLAYRYSYVELDMWVIMPNHLHGILVIGDPVEGGSVRSLPTQKPKPLGRLIGAFKTTSTKAVNEFYHSPGESFWQRNYYEHIIRNEADLTRIREYILANPSRWETDEYFSP